VTVRVGIACNSREVSTARGNVSAETVARAYVDATRRAGGLPLLLPVLDPDDVGPLLDAVARLLVIGGGDVDPRLYGAERVAECGPPDHARDAFEVALVRAAVGREVRTLAICRGMQVTNVALGGTLRQHVEGHSGDVRHRVTVEAGSALSGALGATALDVNSQHHQAVDRLGDRLRPAGWTDDGTIEAVESSDGRLLAVQWHPELFVTEPEHAGLFRWLVG